MKLAYGDCALFNVPFELSRGKYQSPVAVTGRRPARKALRALKKISENADYEIPVCTADKLAAGAHDLIIVVGGQAVLNMVKDAGLPIYFIPTVNADKIYDCPSNVTLVICDPEITQGFNYFTDGFKSF